jgi:diguanylate cyclase (GGDEF)-like protein/PAS domain S-box-containing protein
MSIQAHPYVGTDFKSMKKIPGLSGTNLIEAAFLAQDQPVVVVDWQTRHILAANEAVYRVFGWRPEEVQDCTTKMLHVDEESFRKFGEISEAILGLQKDTFHCSYQMRRRDGSIFDTENMVGIIRGETGVPVAVVSVISEVSTGHSFKLPRGHGPGLTWLSDHIHGGIFQGFQRPDGTVVYNFICPGLAEQFGIDPERARTDPNFVLERLHPDDRKRLTYSMNRSRQNLSVLDIELRACSAKGELRSLRSISQPRRLDDGSVIWDGLILDTTEQRFAESRVQHLVMHDRVTGLPNVVTFEERLQDSITNAAEEESLLVVGALNVSRFYLINESLGFSQGDDALRKIGTRLSTLLHGNDMVARYEGDAFLFFAQDLETLENVRRLGQEVITLFDEPLELDDGTFLSVTVKVGLAVFPDGAETSDALRRKADLALQRVRKDPDRDFEFYSEEMSREARATVTLENNLKAAISKNAIVPHYQPQFNSDSGRLCGMEVLARWPLPEGGAVSPARFIPLAEETGLIHTLMERLVDTVLSHIWAWHQKDLSLPPVAINVSAHQIRRHGFFDWLFERLAHYDLGVEVLTVELTESAFLLDFAHVRSTLESLAERGVRLSIDDFGTGYCSGSMIPDTNVGGKIATINEVSDDQKATFFFS